MTEYKDIEDDEELLNLLGPLTELGIDGGAVKDALGPLNPDERQWVYQMLREHLTKGSSDTLKKMFTIEFFNCGC